MKKKHFVYIAVIVISLSIIGGIQHFFNGDPVKKELEGLLQNTKNDTFPVIDEHDTDKYHEKAMKFKEKSALMTKGIYFDIAGGSLKSPKGIVCTDQGIVITDYDANLSSRLFRSYSTKNWRAWKWTKSISKTNGLYLPQRTLLYY